MSLVLPLPGVPPSVLTLGHVCSLLNRFSSLDTAGLAHWSQKKKKKLISLEVTLLFYPDLHSKAAPACMMSAVTCVRPCLFLVSPLTCKCECLFLWFCISVIAVTDCALWEQYALDIEPSRLNSWLDNILEQVLVALKTPVDRAELF